VPTLYDRYGRPLGPVVGGPMRSTSPQAPKPTVGAKNWPQGGDSPSGWPHGGDALPPYHYPNNPIDTYHAQQEGQPDSGDNEPPSSPTGASSPAQKHRAASGSSAVTSAVVKRAEAFFTTMLQYEQSQLKPRGRLGSTALLTAVTNPAFPASADLYIPDIELCRLEGIKAGTRVTLSSKNGPFMGLSNATPGAPVGPQDFALTGAGNQPRVLLKIRVGGGNRAGGDQTLQVVPAGVPLTLAGESIYVTAGVYLDELGLSPFFMENFAGGTFSVSVSAFLSVQGDHVDQRSTQWVPPSVPLQDGGAIETDNGVEVFGPRHLKQAHGFASAANPATVYLMFFDWNAFPPAGSIPLFTIPVPPGDHFSWDCITSSRKFEWGIVWVLSTAPDLYEPAIGYLARVDLELYADLQVEPIIP
jgi:hypothetical protein